MIDAKVIDEAARVLAESAGSPARVILFGSGARGALGADGDLDFLVIEREVSDRIAEAVRLRRAIGDIGVPVDVIVLDEELAAKRGDRGPQRHAGWTSRRRVLSSSSSPRS